MPCCEKCWGDAYVRSLGNGKGQEQNYHDLLIERKDNPCSFEEQHGQFLGRRFPMEELQKALTAKIDGQLKSDSPNIQYLDVLNRLLGTVSSWLLAKKNN